MLKENVFTADVTFLSREEGGRKTSLFDHWELHDGRRVQPPAQHLSPYYLPNARFDDLPQPPRVMYGLFIQWMDTSEDGLECHVQFAFRADDSAQWAQKLHVGSRFQLFDGSQLVATGRVTGGPFNRDMVLHL